MRKQLWLVIIVLLFAGLACSFGASSGPADTPSTGTNSGPMPTASNVLFEDDFSSSSSGWDRSAYDFGETDYVDGGYHIAVTADYSSVWSNPGISASDVSVEVDGSKRGGVDDNEYGVICRYQDEGNFYAGSISSDGFYAIIKIQNGEFGYVGAESMQPSDLISQGDATNRVRLDCVGSTLTLYVNGSMLVSASDSSFASGDVGLYAGSFATPDVDIFFDNFVAQRP